MIDKEVVFPIWDDRYEKLGVTPIELYMRQNQLCWLTPEVEDGVVTLYCTDGKDKAQTNRMINPTFECIKCISKFTETVISGTIAGEQKTNIKQGGK